MATKQQIDDVNEQTWQFTRKELLIPKGLIVSVIVAFDPENGKVHAITCAGATPVQALQSLAKATSQLYEALNKIDKDAPQN